MTFCIALSVDASASCSLTPMPSGAVPEGCVDRTTMAKSLPPKIVSETKLNTTNPDVRGGNELEYRANVFAAPEALLTVNVSSSPETATDATTDDMLETHDGELV